MKTLAIEDDKQAILARLNRLSADANQEWGRMTAHQMICHLSDSFKVVTGEKNVSSAITFLNRTIVRWIALRFPVTWPKGAKTMPEVDQHVGGTPPQEFEADRRDLIEAIGRFCADRSKPDRPPHPIFGKMSESEWYRWGYLHMDHHLRQFGL